jgi:hypothetical protein
METPTISITRALAELKTLQARIDRLTSETTFIGTRTTGKAFRDFVPSAKASFQAILDLQKRQQSIKFAILRSNSSTVIKIGDQSITVAEAIALKECMKARRNLLETLQHQRLSVNNAVEQHERNLQSELDKLLNKVCSSSSDKRQDDEISAITEAYRKNNRIEVVDPLKLDEKIESMSREIDEYLGQIDFTLSESNSLTQISV